MNTHERVSAMTTLFNPRREPALILMAVAAPLVTVIVSLLPIDVGLATAINAVAVAAAGAGTAWLVRSDQLAPALLGLAQAVLTVALAVGLNLSAAGQTAFLTVIGLLVGAFVRGIVDAPVGPVSTAPATTPTTAPAIVAAGQRVAPSPS